MSDSLKEMLSQALDGFNRKQAEFVSQQQKMNALSASATSPRQVVAVTVGARGELTDLKFPTSAYKRLPPAELASVILKTADEARSQLMKQSAELLAPTLPSGLSAEELVSGTVSLESILSARHGMNDPKNSG